MSATDPAGTTSPAEALEHLGRLPLPEQSMRSLLEPMADQSKTVMPGNPESGLDRGGVRARWLSAPAAGPGLA